MLKAKIAPLYERLNHDDELNGESNSISNQKSSGCHFRILVAKILPKFFQKHFSRRRKHLILLYVAYGSTIAGMTMQLTSTTAQHEMNHSTASLTK